VSANWQESLLNAKELIVPAKASLRFDLPWVPISTIAEQFYCEAKVDFEYRYGRVPTPAKEEGTELHDEIIEMEPTTPKDLVKSIARKPSCLCTFPVYARIEDMAIMGVPDAVLFKKSRPSNLIELKTTSGDVSRLWRDQVVQVKAYGLALDSMGFECASLQLSLIRVNKQGITDEIKEQLLNEVAAAFLLGEVGETEKKLNEQLGGQVKIHLLNYDRQDALRDVMWAKGYWLMKREAIPTKNQSKCRACEFNADCPYSLAKSARG
jgi:CRISPR/Cas system-associated exonuclease Cas4 (RecB family)